MVTALSAALALLVVAQQAAGYPCTPGRRADCAKPPGGLTLQQIPQFVTVTWDDAITSQSFGIVQQILGGLKQRNGCLIPSTYFVTVQDTVPAAVQALYLAGNEIATHTLTHKAYPSAQEIVGCRDWLTNQTGIPRQKINGFRAPFLLHNAATRRALAAAGFLYDSSLPDAAPSAVSPSVWQRAFPYRMDAGIPQTCETGSCSASERWPLWELPLWAAADAAGRPIASTDPAGDAYEIYKRELGWRLGGNRAPLGLFLHAGAESAPERIAQLRKFVQYAAAQKDVWFVTNQQLLAWKAQPVPASAIAAQLVCKTPTDIASGVKACSTFVSDCKFGTWDGRKCRCVCMGEGAPSGFGRSRTGECSLSC